ncbi:MAG: DUF2626 domain-containing protein [Bacillaceae bacterium]|nr:DUF2626 domain-containing protein [Bacillaceae bacterium]
MARMYRVLAFWTLMIGIMALWGELVPMAILFFGQTAAFIALSYLNLTEKMYLYIFFGYMVVSFTGFSFYAFFMMDGAGEHALSALSMLV